MAEFYGKSTAAKSRPMMSDLPTGEYVSLAEASRRLGCTFHLAYAALEELKLLPDKSGKGITINVRESDILESRLLSMILLS